MSNVEDSATTSETRPRNPQRQNTAQELEKRLGQRPTQEDLQNRNILKEGNVAPSLQAAKERLQRSQLEDKLDQALQQRPKPEELVKGGILQPDEAPAEPAAQA
ncbi:hypothetical protein PENSPDRAFT_736857 [Peniophora sp. CONT]|nr:hypothetical protein PENSPDRAFT_736857 [Peniophora sp. CONT]